MTMFQLFDGASPSMIRGNRAKLPLRPAIRDFGKSSVSDPHLLERFNLRVLLGSTSQAIFDAWLKAEIEADPSIEARFGMKFESLAEA
jgi:hypothetical protein